MCLIVVKPKGQPMPSNEELGRWFNLNPDGVGIAFQYWGKVRIIKGAMTSEQMFKLVEQVKHTLGKKRIEDVTLMIQYRRAITGSVCPKFCHPFPISPNQKDLDKLDVITDCALAHNGVISEYARGYLNYDYGYCLPVQGGFDDINDAQEFIKDYLVDMGKSLWNPGVLKLIESYTASKFALLTAKGVTFIGQFVQANGYWYSNDGYAARQGQNTIPAAFHAPCGDWSENERCSFCNEMKGDLYSPPDDDDCNIALCESCFHQLMGREPILQRVIRWAED